MIIKRKLYSLAGTRFLAGFNKKVLRKSPMAAKRSAVKTQNKVLTGIAKGLNKAGNIKTAINQAALNPGAAVNRGIETTLRNPIATSGQVASIALPAVNPALAAVPIGTPSIATEAFLKKKVPAYSKFTNKLANRYNKSEKTKKIIETGTNELINTFKSI